MWIYTQPSSPTHIKTTTSVPAAHERLSAAPDGRGGSGIWKWLRYPQMNPPRNPGVTGLTGGGSPTGGVGALLPESGGVRIALSPTEVTGVVLSDSTRGAEMNHSV